MLKSALYIYSPSAGHEIQFMIAFVFALATIITEIFIPSKLTFALLIAGTTIVALTGTLIASLICYFETVKALNPMMLNKLARRTDYMSNTMLKNHMDIYRDAIVVQFTALMMGFANILALYLLKDTNAIPFVVAIFSFIELRAILEFPTILINAMRYHNAKIAYNYFDMKGKRK